MKKALVTELRPRKKPLAPQIKDIAVVASLIYDQTERLFVCSFYYTQLVKEKYEFFPLNRALSLSAMDEDST